MAETQREFKSPEDRLFLTVDFEDDFTRMNHLMRSLGQQVHAVKLGQGFLLYERWPQLNMLLQSLGVTRYLDIKSHEDPDQMVKNTSKIANKLKFEYMSVHASAKEENLCAAAQSAGKMAVVAALSYSSKGVIEKELDHIEAANQMLEPDECIAAIMCNAEQLEYTTRLDGVLRIATGIRMPGDVPHDQPFVTTPAEALAAGADMLAIGRAITGARKPEAVFERILENMATAL